VSKTILKRLTPYITINNILAGLILLVAGYSGIFSAQKNNYPVSCIHQQQTGKPCPTCGLSRSFSYCVRLQFTEAETYSPFGPRIFSFFLIEFFLRLLFTLLLLKHVIKSITLVWVDSIVTTALFIYTFYPVLQILINNLHTIGTES
jgi:hypothetical protein